MKFIIKFISIFILAVFANAENNTTGDNNISDINKTEIKQEVVQMLNHGENNETDEVVDIIAEKIANSQANENNFSDSPALISVLKELAEINRQILLLSGHNDSNATISELATLNKNKRKLLEQIPMAITNQTVSRENVIEYTKKKERVERILARNKNQYSYEYIKTKILANSMRINEIFFTTFIKTENLFINGAKKSELQNEFRKALLDLETEYATLYDYTDEILNKKNLLNSKQKDEINETLEKFKVYKITSDEVLNYLLQNSDLLASNILFTGLNLKQILNYINDKMPFNTNKINAGKWILIIIITLFFYSLRKFLAKIIYFIFKIFNKSGDSEAIKIQIIDIIKKPLGVLLIAYAIDICSAIFYYPAPVPIKFGNFFSIIYIILYAWLIIKILDGYGIMLLGSIARKSGRKEVINLIIKILYIIVVIIALLFVLSRLGFNISALIASLGIGGLAIALATKDIIANFFASILLLFDNSFSQGDWVVIGDVEGTVVETGLRKTLIRTFDNALVSVPNSKIMENNIKNWNRRKVGRIIKITVGLNYSSTAEQIKNCVNDIEAMLLNHPDIAQPKDNALNQNNLKMFYKQNMVSVDDLAGYKNTLYVSLNEFSDSSIDIYIECFTKTIKRDEYYRVKQDIMIKIMEIVEKYDTEFAFPSQSLYIEKFPKIEIKNPKGTEHENV